MTSTITWLHAKQEHAAQWQSEAGLSAPSKLQVVDDTITADQAYRLACEGVALLWQGDFQNARQLLQAMARRIEQSKAKKPAKVPDSPAQAFNLHRLAQSQRARTLGMLLIPLNADYTIPLRRAPDVALACEQAYGKSTQNKVLSLRELLGLIGAYEWRKKGVFIPALQANIHPHYAVFSPVRGEYIELVAKAPLAQWDLALDIGTGTGVLAAVLAKRGIKQVIATDQDARALACANDNMQQLGLGAQVRIVQADLYPENIQAPLIVCNPPWLPARPSSPIEYAVYDPDNRMLLGFLQGLRQHLTAQGEAWLILSDLAEHLGLRTRAQLLEYFEQAGLTVIAKLDTKPQHGKVTDKSDALHQARAAETTSLWRLRLT